MRALLALLMLLTTLLAFEQKTEVGIQGIGYSEYTNEATLVGKSDLSYKGDAFEASMQLEFLLSSEYKERRFVQLNELYITKEYESVALSFGERIKFWGELEGYNIVDIYNQKNFLKDPFDKGAKYGSVGADAIWYLDESSLEFGIKLYEQDIKLPTSSSPYALLPMDYDATLQTSASRYTPSLYLKANFSTEEIIESETSLILYHGYDAKRYYTPLSQTTLAQYAYRATKAMLHSHLLFGESIVKMELAYTKSEDEKISDYGQLGIGVEHGFYDIAGNDLTLFLEYYRYLYKERDKIENVDIAEIYDNDIFMAARLTFNDIYSSELKVGGVQDLTKDETLFKAEAQARLFDDYLLKTEYLQTFVKTEDNSLLSRIGDTKRLTLSVLYTF